MTTQSFEAAVSNAATQEHPTVQTIKETVFAAPLKELREFKVQWDKLRPSFLARLTRIQQRIDQAAKVGVDPNHVHRLVGRLLQELSGGSREPGLLNTISDQIQSTIDQMEKFKPDQVHLRTVWVSWTGEPVLVHSNIHGIEERLGWLEDLVKDGGQLQALVEAAMERKAGVAA